YHLPAPSHQPKANAEIDQKITLERPRRIEAKTFSSLVRAQTSPACAAKILPRPVYPLWSAQSAEEKQTGW
ncbi:hypothetical protein ABT115_27805, partial [Streptomyces sp. NPDC001832]|uniref:hypothetical protein n=1 Tax=Streptomyces sp. NPDC001832 TaxID=3154527 RepID=UPI003327A9BD